MSSIASDTQAVAFRHVPLGKGNPGMTLHTHVAFETFCRDFSTGEGSWVSSPRTAVFRVVAEQIRYT